MTCSIAREPDLEEWTSRAKIADLLHEPVGVSHSACKSIIIFHPSLARNIISSHLISSHLINRFVLPWLGSIQAYQIPTSLY